MGSDGDIDPRRKRRRISPPETGPYVLRSLLEDVPVQAEDGEGQAHITCVEYWNENLYVGTSAGEILHFVSLPPESELEAGNPSFILASRQPITSSARTATSCGIQQILVLATASKACVLCNGSVFFYSLPELSPAYGTTKVANCNWIGGLDLDEPDAEDGEEASDPIIMLGMQDKIMLVRIGEGPRRVRNIEFPGCLIANRRGTIACVADSRSYALLEVEHRQKIPLFPISSNDEYDEFKVEDIPSRSESPARDKLPVASNGNSGVKTHGRSTSLNAIAASSDLRQQSTQPDVSGTSTPSSLAEGNLPKPTSPHDRRLSIPSRSPSAAPGDGLGQKPLPPTPSPTPKKTISMLKPHIVSPTPSEFLLVTGTDASNPAVGMFVNLEGETAERGTIEFQTYPDAIVLDNGDEDPNSHPSGNDADGYVLAVVNAAIDTEAGGEVVEEKCLEVQRWDVNPGEGGRQRSLINVSLEPPVSGPVGIARTVSPNKINFADVGELLQVVRLKVPDLRTPGSTTPQKNNDPRTEASIEQLQKEKELFENDSDSSKQVKLRRGWEAERNAEELAFAKTLGYVKSNVMLWEGNQIWRVLRNPLALQLENALTLTQEVQDARTCRIADKGAIIDMMARLDSILPRTAPESLGLNYVKQKASLLLFGDLIATNPEYQTPSAIKSVEDVLIAGELDPRIILLFTPLLREEILQGPQGIWICAGLTKVVDTLLEVSKDQDGTIKFNFTEPILRMLVRYLTSWHRKRGYGSVTDDTYVFDSVDSALLRLLLHLDATHNEAVNGKTVASDVRQELNKLVDNWKGNFTRAVELLELYQRLFVLSRLYQSRKMSGHVLRTWRRTIEGEKDVGGEMTIPAVELQVRKYLMKIRDPNLVEEYGLWLAARNPKLGIQVFSDDSSRVQFDPPQVIRILKDRAPGAVQVYLEHLVFTKNITRYADDLISYYLDTVISVLETSPEARASLTESYSTYRALRPPKPSYLSFITENAPPEPWWQSRLRLLQLLGGVARSQFTSAASLPSDLPYSISAVLERIEPFKNELVSECIILGGRQGRHDDALHLLTHGLGDYDSAIRYCLFEGSGASASHSMFSRKFSPSEGQKQLFAGLLREFLHIADPSERTERTGDLLARFAPLFDVREVLDLVPDEWSVDALSEYFARALRDLTSESRNAKVQRALSAGLNLKVCADFIKESEKIGGWIEDASEVKPLKGDKDITAEPEPHAEGAAKNNQSPNEAGTQIRPDDTLKIS